MSILRFVESLLIDPNNIITLQPILPSFLLLVGDSYTEWRERTARFDSNHVDSLLGDIDQGRVTSLIHIRSNVCETSRQIQTRFEKIECRCTSALDENPLALLDIGKFDVGQTAAVRTGLGLSSES